MNFSEKEQALYDFIRQTKEASVESIEKQLGAKVVGAIGKLLREEVIEKKKVKEGEGYNMKLKTVYVLNLDKIIPEPHPGKKTLKGG
jgi:hypothetical protein